MLRVFVHHYNTQRPHRAFDLRPPNCENEGAPTSYRQINRREGLGGLHEYYRAAA